MATTISQTPYMATNQYGAAPQIVTQQPVVPAATTTTTTTSARPMRTTFIGKHWSGFAILLALAATVLYIVAIVTPAYWADHDGNGIGLYRSCSVDKFGNNQQCSSVSSSCRMQLNGLIDHKLPSCDKLRAMQALGVTATVLAGIVVILMLFTHYRQSRYELSSAILFLSMVCGLVLMAIAIDYFIEDIRNDDTVSHFASSLGYSFIIGTVAWVLQLVALCAFSSTHYSTRYSTPYATAY